MYRSREMEIAMMDRMNRLTLEMVMQRSKMSRMQNTIDHLANQYHQPRVSFRKQQQRPAPKSILFEKEPEKENKRPSLPKLKNSRSTIISNNGNKRRGSRLSSVFIKSGKSILKKINSFEQKLDYIIKKKTQMDKKKQMEWERSRHFQYPPKRYLHPVYNSMYTNTPVFPNGNNMGYGSPPIASNVYQHSPYTSPNPFYGNSMVNHSVDKYKKSKDQKKKHKKSKNNKKKNKKLKKRKSIITNKTSIGQMPIISNSSKSRGNKKPSSPKRKKSQEKKKKHKKSSISLKISLNNSNSINPQSEENKIYEDSSSKNQKASHESSKKSISKSKSDNFKTKESDESKKTTFTTKTNDSNKRSKVSQKTDGPIYYTISNKTNSQETIDQIISQAQIYTERNRVTDEAETENIENIVTDNINIFWEMLNTKLINLPKKNGNIFFKKQITLKRQSKAFSKYSTNSRNQRFSKPKKNAKNNKKFKKAVNAVIFLKRYALKIKVLIIPKTKKQELFKRKEKSPIPILRGKLQPNIQRADRRNPQGRAAPLKILQLFKTKPQHRRQHKRKKHKLGDFEVHVHNSHHLRVAH